jgi:hypothetical protein
MAKVRLWPAERIVHPDAQPVILSVRDPRTMRLVDPVDGIEVEDTEPHFARLLRDGDVVDQDPGRSPSSAKARKSSATSGSDA